MTTENQPTPLIPETLFRYCPWCSKELETSRDETHFAPSDVDDQAQIAREITQRLQNHGIVTFNAKNVFHICMEVLTQAKGIADAKAFQRRLDNEP